MERVRIHILGMTQGVGYRPFLARRAALCGIVGFVRNDGAAVVIEAQAPAERLGAFLKGVKSDVPDGAVVRAIEVTQIEATDSDSFEILSSESAVQSVGGIPLDRAPCAACRVEMRDPTNRRYLYPFTNCTACGPRYTVIDALPFDRQRTAMTAFDMCHTCRFEYESPADRRFHSQLNGCPDCGPEVVLSSLVSKPGAPMKQAAQILLDGGVVALKGVGGYQIACLASNELAIGRVRYLKSRPHKPLAVLFKSCEQLAVDCEVSEVESALIAGAGAPIVLVWRRSGGGLSAMIAPGMRTIGALLPSSPLHAILAELVDQPLVLTSGNLAGEPIIIDDIEAMEKLAPRVDGVLIHNRRIARAADDAVMQVVGGRPMTLRLGRGTSPLEVAVACPPGVLAVGGHLKNTVAISLSENRAVISPHIGTLTSVNTRARFASTIANLTTLCGQTIQRIANDQHPDYGSSLWAEARSDLGRTSIPHHVAHVAATWSEHHMSGRALALAWDGWGLGEDGTMWGGEFFEMTAHEVRRIGHLRAFSVPGGAVAAQDPRRSAVGLLHSSGLLDLAKEWMARVSRDVDVSIFVSMIERGIQSPMTSSVGRLFDAVASVLGLCDEVTFEGQAAMAVQAAAEDAVPTALNFKIGEDVIDPTDLLSWMLTCGPEINVGQKALALHQWLVEAVVALCKRRALPQIVVGGGVFQNRLLTEMLIGAAARHDVKVFVPESIPPNDGGLAYGQLAAYGRWHNVSGNSR